MPRDSLLDQEMPQAPTDGYVPPPPPPKPKPKTKKEKTWRDKAQDVTRSDYT